MKTRTLAGVMLALLAFPAPAQRPARPQPDPLVSPEVQADGRVTFRLRAAKAGSVTLRGEWMAADTRVPLDQDARGFWTVTVGPLPPDIYSYSFSVDEVTITDPQNPGVKLGSRSSNASVLEAPGRPPLLHELRDVPHGAVEVNWYKSETLGHTRRFYVYTPPTYYANASARFPALYLLHGNGDTEGEWTWFGRANVILDNLLAEGRIKPMIVVMPYGHAVPPRDLSPESRGQNTKLFEQDLLRDVIPRAEAKYRVAAGPKNHAIAGLSMGGGQSVNVGLNNLNVFGSIGVFSAGVGGGGPSVGASEFESRFQSVLSDANATNKKLSLLWIGCGEQDAALAGAEALAGVLQKMGSATRFARARERTRGGSGGAIWRN